eukprot:3940401-Rhodomonas_salina.1
MGSGRDGGRGRDRTEQEETNHHAANDTRASIHRQGSAGLTRARAVQARGSSPLLYPARPPRTLPPHPPRSAPPVLQLCHLCSAVLGAGCYGMRYGASRTGRDAVHRVQPHVAPVPVQIALRELELVLHLDLVPQTHAGINCISLRSVPLLRAFGIDFALGSARLSARTSYSSLS